MKHPMKRALASAVALCLCLQMALAASPLIGATEAPAQQEAGETTVTTIQNDDAKVVTDTGEPVDWSIWEVLRFTTKQGATVTVPFAGTKIVMYGQKATNGPILSVSIDNGAAEDVDFYSTNEIREKVWEKDGLSEGEHTAVFTFTDRHNPASAEVEAGKGFQAAIDRFVVTTAEGDATIEDSDEAVIFDTGEVAPWDVEGDYSQTDMVGATITVPFTGSAIAVQGKKLPTGYKLSATIDGGETETFDTYAEEAGATEKLWEKTDLTEEAHTLLLKVTADKNAAASADGAKAAIDCFAVTATAVEPPAPAGDYTRDYEDGETGTWAGATATIVADPANESNKVLKLDMNGFAVDTAAPKLADGTLSFKLRNSTLTNFGLLYRARETANADKQANQFVRSPETWLICNEGGTYDKGFPLYGNQKLDFKADTWQEVKLQFSGDNVEIAIDGVRYGVFTKAGFSKEAGVFGFRVWGSARTIYIDDVLFTEDMLPMGELYEEPPIEVPRITYEKTDYSTPISIPAGEVTLDDASPDVANALNTWRLLTAESTGAFGVAFNATQGSFNAIYTDGGGNYSLRLPDGSVLPLATGSARLTPNTEVKVQVTHVGDLCTLYVNGVEVGSVENAAISDTEGKIGLYNPGQEAVSVTLSSGEVYELFYYENDFSDTENLGGWDKGAPTQTEDGKLQLKMNFVGNAVAMDTPVIANGVYEFDFTSNAAGQGRAGFLFRCFERDYQSMFYDIGSNWFWLNGSAYGAVPVGAAIEPDREYAVKLTVKGTSVSMELDGDTIYSGNISSLSSAVGRFGFRKQFSNGVLTVDNLKISELCTVRPDDVVAVPETITDSTLDVTMDKVFPRVIEYEMNGKTLLGNQKKAYGIILNGKTYYPMVSAEKSEENALVYTLSIPTIGVTVELTYRVAGNKLEMTMTDLVEASDFLVTSLAFEDAALVSTTADDATASHASVETGGGWYQVQDFIYDDMGDVEDADLGTAGRGYAMLSSGGMAGTVNNSGVEAADKLSVRFYKDESSVVGTIGDGTLTVRTPLDMQEGTRHEVWSTVAICEDYNEDGNVDWQDAAANYYNIRSEIVGMDTMKENMMYITMNFASQVQQPFLRTLDLGKSVYNYTDGFGQMVMHKGFAAEGHDDSHADYGGHVGVRQGGAADFNYAIEEGANYNMLYGIHINVSEHNPDAYYFSPEDMVRPLSANWGWIDQAYWVDEKKDILSGNRAENLDRLKETLPNLAFTYIDIYGSSTWMAENLVTELNDRGFIAGTEFGGAMEMGAAFTHWGNDRAYPNHGNNSTILRFIKNDLNVFVTNGLFNSSNMPLVGSWSNSNNVKDVSLSFFNNVLPTKYLQHFPVLKITDTSVKFSDGVMTEKKADSENPGKFIVEMTKDGKLLATWEWVDKLPDDTDVHAWAASDTGDAVVFIPWYGEASETKDPDEAAKIYHWNAKGGETTWDVPAAWGSKGIAAADVYQLSGDDKVKVSTINIEGGKLTLTAEAETGYVLYPAGSPAPKVAGNFGEGSGMTNPGFDDTKLAGWTVDESKGADASVIKSTDNGEPRLKIAGDKDQSATLSQTITGLEGGKDYTLYLFANVGETGKVDVTVRAGETDYTAKALHTVLRHFDQSKYLNLAENADEYDNFQKMTVVFHVPEGKNTAELTLTGTLGEDGGAVFADDLTLFDALVENPPVAGVGDYQDYALYENFENVEQGLGVFTYSYLSAGNTHLAERNESMNQFTDYVLEGNFSLKSNEFGLIGEAFRSRPDQLSLKANTKYEIGFTYETGLNGAHKVVVKRPNGDVVYSKTLTATELNGAGANVVENFTIGDYTDAYLAIEYLADIKTVPLAPGIAKPEGSAMEYNYVSLDDVYIRTPAASPNVPGGSSSNTTTTTEKNTDGSTTKTVTDKKTGNVTETTTYPDGTKIVATTPKDGKPSIEVTLPKGKDSVTVTIPTDKKPAPGEVVVIVREDGTKEIIKTSVATEDGMRLTLTAGAKLEIIDNSKSFADVPADHWGADAIAFVTSRELFNGGDSGFQPAGDMNRAMLFTVLARLDGQDLTGGETWYENAMLWAKESSISDGTSPDAGISREQLAVMLYRYAKAEKTENDLKDFSDAGSVSDWAAEAMAWAVKSGIITGKGGALDPQGNASRAEVATMLQRFIAQ